MTDTEMLDWINENLTSIVHTMRDEDCSPYEIEWIDDKGRGQKTIGNNIRDCVDHAANPHKV